MNNRAYSVLQIVGVVALGIIIVIQVILFINVSSRMDAIEQKQAVLERHMDIIRSEEGYP